MRERLSAFRMAKRVDGAAGSAHEMKSVTYGFPSFVMWVGVHDQMQAVLEVEAYISVERHLGGQQATGPEREQRCDFLPGAVRRLKLMRYALSVSEGRQTRDPECAPLLRAGADDQGGPGEPEFEGYDFQAANRQLPRSLLRQQSDHTLRPVDVLPP